MGRSSLPTVRVSVYTDASPADIFDNLDKINGFTQMQGFHTTVNFVVLKLRGLVNHHAARRPTGMTATIQVH